MKTAISFIFFIVCISYTSAQYNTPWTINTLNTSQSGFIGIGTKNNNGTTNLPLPHFNLHLHGTVDYLSDDGQSSFAPLNYGKTVRLGFTNTVTSFGANDGTLLMAAQNDFYLWNRENGNLYLKSNGASMTFDYPSKAIWIGGTPSTNAKYGYLNIITPKNGVYIETSNNTKKSLTINSRNDLTTAVEIFGTDQIVPSIKLTGLGVIQAKRFESSISNNEVSIAISDNVSNLNNFKVFGSGEVYARKYVATINNFPDYVFVKGYNLLPIRELQVYISNNGKLPNFPSATEVDEKGLDIGEINRLLVEKVEELTLYIIQLEGRVNKLEGDN
jgi:hypothetical protein